jgi:hypothetical protein
MAHYRHLLTVFFENTVKRCKAGEVKAPLDGFGKRRRACVRARWGGGVGAAQ